MKNLILTSLLLATVAACTIERNAPEVDYDSLLNRLRNDGAEVTEIGEILQTCFLANPKVALVNDGSLEIYEYADTLFAESAFGKITPGTFEAQLNTAKTTTATELYLHFYKGDRLLVRYMGNDPLVLAALESALGPQFADDVSGIKC